MKTVPGRVRLSTNEACPVRSLRSSLRGTLVPIQLCASVAAMSAPDGLDGLDDVLVAGATAEVPLERPPYLVLARRGVLLEQADGREHHPRRAEPALEGVLLVKGLLHGMEIPVLRQALDRRDLRPVGLDAEHGARLDRLAVDEHRAGAAGRRVAADVRARQAETIAEDVDEELPGLEVELVRSPVDAERDASHG